MWLIATDVARSVACVSVSGLGTWVDSAKTAEQWASLRAADVCGSEEPLLDGVRIGATWRIRLNDLCGSGDAVCCYHYCSNISSVLLLWLLSWCTPSVLWRCWLGGRKSIRPVKTEWWGASVVICLDLGADLHMAQLMPLPLTVPCFSKIQIGFAFLVPAHPGSPRKKGR